MNRVLLICAALALTSATATAQKANVKKLKSKIEWATTPVNMDYSNLDAEKVQELRDLIDPALTNPESKDEAILWKYAARMKMHDMNEQLKARAANNNEFTDANAFFQTQYDIVSYLEKYIKLLNTPNEKGKYDMKDEEREKERKLMQTMASNPRNNLFIAATNLVNTDPKKCADYLQLYYDSFENPLFKDVELKDEEKARVVDSYYIYATALKTAGADEAKVKEYLNKAIDSEQFGKNALYDLMDAEKKSGNMAGWSKLCEQAIDKFPQEGVFGRLLLQQYINDKKWDNVISLADKLIARNTENGVQDEWPYYFKAASYFSTDKLKEAYDAFVKCAEVKPEFADALSGAGKTAWKLAQDNATKKDVSKAWYQKAIDMFEKCRAVAPDNSDLWGYSLYACYNNTGNVAKAKEFKKYNK